ncbi:coiled-coil domain-containing protein 18 isoform X2 [Heterodontus francisci]|uniref:coiled-coil domain-containing protein 18 isoform X2 n=1 Tax=Heterodontus francisci TaxID=7792 RepID=UPI00355B34C9
MKMPQDETVCKYCGVSYLIHREFKLMEEKVKAMEAEMEFYRESVEREKKLQGELCSVNQCLEQLKSDNQRKKESLNFLNLQLATKQKELENTFLKMEGIWGQLVVAQNQSKLFRERTKQQEHIVEQATTFLQGIRIELAVLREEVRSNLVIWGPFSKTLTHCVEATSSAVQMEIFKLQESLKKSNQEVEFLQQQVRELHISSNTIALQTHEIHVLKQKEAEIQIRYHELQKQTHNLENQLMTKQLCFEKITEEMEQCKELLLNKSKEATDLLSRVTKLECAHEEGESRYCKEIKEKEEGWLHCEQKCKSLEEQLQAKVCKESEIQNQSSHTLNELLTLKSALCEAEEKLAALKQEREQMMISHQNRIEQLQESLRQRLGDEDSWRVKIDAELSKQRAHHCTELKELELRMKKEATFEMDIVKQKQQELINKYKEEYKTLQAKVSDLISDATRGLQLEVIRMKKKFQETQYQLMERERSKDDEICNLEKVIFQLNRQLKQQDKVECMTEELRTEIQQKSIEIRETQQEIQQLKEELGQAKKENTFLEETVRRECEERYELTEALSQAREQLMELKRVSRELPHSHRSVSQRSFSSSSSPAGSQLRKAQRTLSDNSRTKLSGLHGPTTNANVLNNAGSTALPVIPVPHSSKGRASSVSEIKQRIAAAVRRK